MSFASKYSKKNPFNFTFPEKGNAHYSNLTEFAKFYGDTPVQILCLSINEQSKFGPQPCVWFNGDNCLNLPKYATEEVRRMINDPEVIEAVNAGIAGVKARKYQGRDGKTYVGFEWVDLPIE